MIGVLAAFPERASDRFVCFIFRVVFRLQRYGRTAKERPFFFGMRARRRLRSLRGLRRTSFSSSLPSELRVSMSSTSASQCARRHRSRARVCGVAHPAHKPWVLPHASRCCESCSHEDGCVRAQNHSWVRPSARLCAWASGGRSMRAVACKDGQV